jgi:hypothetical protein
MRFLECLVLGAGALAVGCGADAEAPFGPIPGDLCAVQHEEGGMAVCDELYAEAPFVHLPEASATRVIAGLQVDSFVTVDGRSFPAGKLGVSESESKRHALALYELELSDGRLESFRPFLKFDEALFVKPFMGRAYEGAISRKDGVSYPFEATLPVRVEILDEVMHASSSGFSFQARAVITNVNDGVTAADGSCMPALTSYGAESPFVTGAKVTLGVSRSPWMHGFGDDEFVLDLFVDGVSAGSMMAPTWYRGPIDLVRGTLAPAGTYNGVGHGTPGYIPTLALEPVEGGGEACTAS